MFKTLHIYFLKKLYCSITPSPKKLGFRGTKKITPRNSTIEPTILLKNVITTYEEHNVSSQQILMLKNTHKTTTTTPLLEMV